jgi:hypothetical protein
VIGSPNGSLAVNRLAAAKLCPWLATTLLLIGVALGPGSSGAMMVKLCDQGLHVTPLLTRTHNVSVPQPVS